jgi:hypothetical protein
VKNCKDIDERIVTKSGNFEKMDHVENLSLEGDNIKMNLKYNTSEGVY